jgi:hypothetical protein
MDANRFKKGATNAGGDDNDDVDVSAVRVA